MATFTKSPAIDQNVTLTYQPARNTLGTATFQAVLEDNGETGGKHKNQSQPQPFTIEVKNISPDVKEIPEAKPIPEIKKLPEVAEKPIEKNLPPNWDIKLRAFKGELDYLNNPAGDLAMRMQDITSVLNKYFVNEQVPVFIQNQRQQKEASDFLLNVVITAQAKPKRKWEIMDAKLSADGKIASLTVSVLG